MCHEECKLVIQCRRTKNGSYGKVVDSHPIVAISLGQHFAKNSFLHRLLIVLIQDGKLNPGTLQIRLLFLREEEHELIHQLYVVLQPTTIENKYMRASHHAPVSLSVCECMFVCMCVYVHTYLDIRLSVCMLLCAVSYVTLFPAESQTQAKLLLS